MHTQHLQPDLRHTSVSNRVDSMTNKSFGNISPAAFLKESFPQISRKRSRHTISCATAQPDESYSMEVVRSIRSNDVATLRKMMKGGRTFDACNRNGESLLHLACRRGNLETVRFLLEDAGANTDIRDDMGRTVLHDVCWKPVPDFELMELLISHVSPNLLFAEDCRGHCCFDYVRKEHWGMWLAFLSKYISVIERRLLIVGWMSKD